MARTLGSRDTRAYSALCPVAAAAVSERTRYSALFVTPIRPPRSGSCSSTLSTTGALGRLALEHLHAGRIQDWNPCRTSLRTASTRSGIWVETEREGWGLGVGGAMSAYRAWP